MPDDGDCTPIPAGLEVPDGYRAVLCLRCRGRLFIPDDIWLYDVPARQRLLGEHHAWLCPNPTPFIAAVRAAQPPIRPWD